MSGNAKQDIIDAAQGTSAAQYIGGFMGSTNFTYTYTSGDSHVDRTTNTIYINDQKAGNDLVGAGLHEMMHSGTYNQYLSEWSTAFGQNSYNGALNAFINNESRTIAGAISITNPNVFAPGYITGAQATQALANAAQIAGNTNSAAYTSALVSQIAQAISANPSTLAAMQSYVSQAFLRQYPDTRHYPPPPELPPANEESSDDADDFYDNWEDGGDDGDWDGDWGGDPGDGGGGDDPGDPGDNEGRPGLLPGTSTPKKHEIQHEEGTAVTRSRSFDITAAHFEKSPIEIKSDLRHLIHTENLAIGAALPASAVGVTAASLVNAMAAFAAPPSSHFTISSNPNRPEMQLLSPA